MVTRNYIWGHNFVKFKGVPHNFVTLENTVRLHRQSRVALLNDVMYNWLVTVYIAETRLAACSDRIGP